MRLSICIATYNRASFIGETLDGILAQAREHQGVEVVVADGASSDATPAEVERRFRGRAGCRYLRLPEKGGVDRDYCRAVEAASGDFCWLMTDDDVLTPGAVGRVLAALGGDPDLLVGNFAVAGPDLSETLIPRKLALEADQAFPPGDQAGLLSRAGILLSFIGSVVVRRSLWLARDPAPFLGSEFAHVGVIFQAPLPRGARLLAEPLVRIRHGNSQWTPRSFEVWMLKWPRLVWGLPVADEAAKAAVSPREPWRRSFDLLLMKAKGCYGTEEYRRWLQPLPMGALTRLRLRAIAAFPDRLYNALMRRALPILFPRARGTVIDLERSRFARRAGQGDPA